MSEILVLPRFFRSIQLHLVGNFLGLSHTPVMCGIFGRPGDGKSAQLDASLEASSTQSYRINASDLESGLAGEPGKLIARTYAAASLDVSKGRAAALIIEDIDTTVGEWEQNTGTVNHQQVIAELMHLADRPVDPARNMPDRVPVFVTGNNVGRLYAPLRRSGRMTLFGWRPSPEELRRVAIKIFADVAGPDEVDALVRDFPDEPIAFFTEVRQRIFTEQSFDRLGQLPVDMRDLLRMRSRVAASFDRLHPVPHYGLLRAAKAVHEDRAFSVRDFIGETGGATA